ncbi:MAG TPA: S49 family peptidase, partial [Aquificales bacterium]|nr:S49 family peptidase [Aquificales bacterium]
GTITGSIGVILQKLEVKKLADKIGIEVEIIKTGKFKDVLNPFREMTPEEKEYLLKLEEDVLNQFKLAIEENRKGKLKVKVDQIADGRIFSGKQALELGLIDKLGNLEDAIAEAGKLAGIKGKPVVVELKREQPLVKRILGTDLKALSFLDGSTTIGVYYLMY